MTFVAMEKRKRIRRKQMNELERDAKIDGLSSEIADLALSGATPDELKNAIVHSVEALDSLKEAIRDNKESNS